MNGITSDNLHVCKQKLITIIQIYQTRLKNNLPLTYDFHQESIVFCFMVNQICPFFFYLSYALSDSYLVYHQAA